MPDAAMAAPCRLAASRRKRSAAGEVLAQACRVRADPGRGFDLGGAQFPLQAGAVRQRWLPVEHAGRTRHRRARGRVEEQELLLDAEGQSATGGKSRVAGPWMTEPSVPNRDP